MLQVALWEPEIPPNTGNIGRLCAANACRLHLIGPLGFRIDDRSLRRAGLDYWEALDLRRHDSIVQFEDAMQQEGSRIFCLSARADVPYTKIEFRFRDCILFGAETRGLPPEIIQRYRDKCFTIPMLSGKVRSLNLATAVGIVLYEGLRQLHRW